MKPLEAVGASMTNTLRLTKTNDETGEPANKPLVSLVVSSYNEAPIMEQHLATLCQYMKSLENTYRWEMIVVNDGSTDDTGMLAEAFAESRDNIRVLHHITNFGLGQALRFAFNHCRGDYIVTLDLDLSYAPDHIRRLLTKIRETRAKVVVASPYMSGGAISNVPWLRRKLSIWANRFLSRTAKGHLSTLTGMVRAYDGFFLRTLNLKSMGMEINAEIIHKAMLLHARIEEIPGQLRWRVPKVAGIKRRSSMRLLRHTFSVLLSGFLFRPVIFFILPGFVLFLLSVYANIWVLIHVSTYYLQLSQYTWPLDRLSAATAAAYSQAPHTFIVGGIALMLAIQLVSLGILALQSKSYFEEMFHLGSSIYRQTLKGKGASHE